MSSRAQHRLPMIDFSSLSPEQHDTDAWHATRAQVMAALEAYGCLEAAYDRVTPELRRALFGPAMDELFALPLETKMKNSEDVPYQGYVGGIPGMAYESLKVDGAPEMEAAESFTRLMWPDGNPSFCKTVWSYGKLLQELEQMIRRMILQCLGIDKYYASQLASSAYGLRLSYYGVPLDQENKMAMNAHKDMNLMTIICQQAEGLEVQARDGEWFPVIPSPNSFTVILGESVWAWTNGRLKAAVHRVRIEANEKRYSTVFGSWPREGLMVQTPEELVDDEHPLLFKPYDYYGYLRFRFSEEGVKAKDALKTYCGAEQEVKA